MKFKAVEQYYHEGKTIPAGEEFEIASPGSDHMALVALGKLETVSDTAVAPMTTQNTSALVPGSHIVGSAGSSSGGGT